ncbi:MAG: hypothetical protein IT366_14985 [Candidatus Hydrogenedentes bacterium]|nr:hypothetical protein [Candidatus Hydrogenedentota bacterium]
MKTQLRRNTVFFAIAFTVILTMLSPPAWAAFGFTPYRALNTNAVKDKRMDANADIATDGNGVWMAVWESNNDLTGGSATDTDIHMSISTDNGDTWSKPSAVNNDAASDDRQEERPRVVSDGDGHWVVAWPAYHSTDANVLVAASADDGDTWSDPQPLNPDENWNDSFVAIATDRQGVWIAVWQAFLPGGSSSTGDTDIYASVSSNNGTTWSSPVLVNTTGSSDSGDDFAPDIASDGADTFVAVWHTQDTLGGTIGDDEDILSARRSGKVSEWSAPVAVNAAVGDSATDEYPRIATDESGTWICTWTSSLTNGMDWEGDVLVANSADDGATWSSATAINASPESDTISDDDACIATNEYGQWFILWSAWKPGNGSDPFAGTTSMLVVGSDDGGDTWTNPYPLKLNAPPKDGENGAPSITCDGDDRWIVVWDIYGKLGDARHRDDDIYLTTTKFPQAITVLKPNGGETINRDEKKKVTWTSLFGVEETVRLELWRDGVFNVVLVSATQNDGSCNVKIPKNADKGKGYTIRIVLDSDPAVFDENDAPFSVK